MKNLLKKTYFFLRQKKCPYTQLLKYTISGCIAVAIDIIVFYLLAWLAFPCLQPQDPVAKILTYLGFIVKEVSADTLIRNYWIIKTTCFFLSNGVVYLLNILFVFEAGRHRKHIEIVLFYAFSVFQFTLFSWIGGVLISQLNWNVTYAYFVVLVLAVIFNFIVRKKLIFRH